MGHDPNTFLIFMGLCVVTGLFLSLTTPERRIVERKVGEEEMAPYLVKHRGPRPKDEDGPW